MVDFAPSPNANRLTNPQAVSKKGEYDSDKYLTMLGMGVLHIPRLILRWVRGYPFTLVFGGCVDQGRDHSLCRSSGGVRGI